jgi:hypothetical protein
MDKTEERDREQGRLAGSHIRVWPSSLVQYICRYLFLASKKHILANALHIVLLKRQKCPLSNRKAVECLSIPKL